MERIPLQYLLLVEGHPQPEVQPVPSLPVFSEPVVGESQLHRGRIAALSVGFSFAAAGLGLMLLGASRGSFPTVVMGGGVGLLSMIVTFSFVRRSLRS